MSAPVNVASLIAQARAVPIERELERRGITTSISCRMTRSGGCTAISTRINRSRVSDLYPNAEWAARALTTRTKIWWPTWFRIREMWGDVHPDAITFEMMSRWRAGLEKKIGRNATHKTLRVWRSFWKIMLGT